MDHPAVLGHFPDARRYELVGMRRARREPAWDEPIREVEVGVTEGLDVEPERAIGEPDDLGVLPELVVEFDPHKRRLHKPC